MSYSYLLENQVQEDNLSPCYVFYGEETFLADQFVRQVRSALLGPDGEPLNVERFDLEETRWAEILDVAKTAPFFFAPWRILIVTSSEESKKKPSAAEEKMIREYCQSPSPKTVLIVIISGDIKKGHPLLAPFDSLPEAAAVRRELKPLKGAKLTGWIEASVRPSGKVVTFEARDKLVEIVGSDLRLLENELDKLLTFAADRRVIDVSDVSEVCDWGRTFEEWELTNSLEEADCPLALKILGRRFQEGVKPELVVGVLARLFRDVLLARLRLAESRDKEDIFAVVKPNLKLSWPIGRRRFREFFALVEELSEDELNRLIGELEKIDTLLKTSDAPAEAMIAGFVIEYCRLRRRGRRRAEATSGKRS